MYSSTSRGIDGFEAMIPICSSNPGRKTPIAASKNDPSFGAPEVTPLGPGASSRAPPDMPGPPLYELVGRGSSDCVAEGAGRP